VGESKLGGLKPQLKLPFNRNNKIILMMGLTAWYKLPN